jgi:glycine cleavage system H protein
MVPILVLLTVVAFFVVEWQLDNRRAAALLHARATPFAREGDLFLHPGHTWVRPTSDGLVSIGASGFACNFAGSPQRIKLPRVGRRLHLGEPAWTLLSKRGRVLEQAMPIRGKVVAVNEALRIDPTLAQRSPYDAGWILRVRPGDLRGGLRNLLHGDAANAWREAVRSTATAELLPAMGMLAQDGGDWIVGFGDELDDESWSRTQKMLFPVSNPEDSGEQP